MTERLESATFLGMVAVLLVFAGLVVVAAAALGAAMARRSALFPAVASIVVGAEASRLASVCGDARRRLVLFAGSP